MLYTISYEVKDNGKMITYNKTRRDLENDHVHNKEIHILKETGKSKYTLFHSQIY